MVTKVARNSLWIILAICTTALMSNLEIASAVPVTINAKGSARTISRRFPQAQISLDDFTETGLREQPTQLTSQQSITDLETLAQLDQSYQIDRIIEYRNQSDNSQAQVTSVSQLSDVQPTDWAFQALQGLVKRYGCIVGYCDGAFWGEHALARYEFATELNVCLNMVSEMIAQGLVNVAMDADLAIMRRLQAEFAAELATLRGRVDTLEAYTAELEVNQFSTTTKLYGEVIFSVAGVLDEDENLDTDNDGEADTDTDSQVTFASQVQLELITSFTGDDELTIQFEAGNIDDFASDPIGFSFSGDTENDLVLDQLFYAFPVGDRAQILIGASGTAVDDFVTSTVNPFDSPFDNDLDNDSDGSGSLSDFGLPRQYSLDPGDIGVGANIQLTDNLILDFGYSVEGNDPELGTGLFNGDYAAIGQLTFQERSLNAAITYVNSYSADGFITDGPEVANTYGAQINFRLLDSVEIGGGLAYINATQIGVQNVNAWSYQLTLAFPNLGKEGNLLGILAGVPLYSRDLLPVNDTGFLLEGFYQYRLTDNIVITPGIIYIADPFNNNDNEDSIIGAVRATFSF